MYWFYKLTSKEILLEVKHGAQIAIYDTKYT